MKRAFILFILLFYCFSATGASFHLHFCGNHLVEVSVIALNEDGCCKGEMHRGPLTGDVLSKKCCKSEIASVKIKSDQVLYSAGLSFNVPAVEMLRTESPISQDAVYSKSITAISHAPPDSYTEAVYVLNCNFRI